MEKKMNNKGFSLVELIIVIAIMAILIGVLAPQFIKYVEQSRESTDLQNVEEIKTAVETYVADGGAGDTITVTLNTSTHYIKPSVDLSSYGIDNTNGVPAKSQKWTGTCTWTYTTSNYSWACGNGTATYYKFNGQKE